ncbi:ABC transporter substrate-binding protein [Streptomyces sp. NPDC079167]|uniref:ABC transporter substrate-binding protein n=1 Tax=Streptomyces sp. NPDC079167 TaxID=3154513 RepID=UPI0034136B18
MNVTDLSPSIDAFINWMVGSIGEQAVVHALTVTHGGGRVPRNWWFPASSPTRGLRGTAGLVVGGLFFLSACGGGGSSNVGSSGGGSDGVLRLALENTLPGWDWRKQISAGHTGLEWRPVYDTLLRTQSDGTVTPNAAEKYSYNDDKTLLTLKLREGMKFTDGAPVDAKAAKLSLEGFRDGGGSDSLRLGGVKVRVVDDLTLTLTLPAANPALISYLGGSSGQLVSPASMDSPTLATKPVGSGPYVLNTRETVTGSKLVFNRNPDYWNPGDFAYDKLEFLVMADETAQLNALSTGQIDGAEISLGSIERAKSSGLHVKSFQNLWSGLFFLDRAGAKIPALGDVRVRKAINMVFDRPAIAEGIWNGNGKANSQTYGPPSVAYQEDLLKYYPYDIEAARKLMKEAGYADGFSVVLPEVDHYNDEYSAIAVQQLAELNIRAKVVSVPRQESIPRILGGEFPMFVYKMPVNPEAEQVSNVLGPKGAFNPYHSADPGLTKLLEKWKVADGDEAADIYKQINRFLVENAWFAPFGNPDSPWAFNGSTTITGTLGTTPPLFAFK